MSEETLLSRLAQINGLALEKDTLKEQQALIQFTQQQVNHHLQILEPLVQWVEKYLLF